MFIVFLSLIFVVMKGAFGGYCGDFVPCFYLLFVLTVIFKAPKAYRFSLAALFGLVADLFSTGRFGAYALSLSLAYFPASLVLEYISSESALSRFLTCFLFVFTASLSYFLFGDNSAPITCFPSAAKGFLVTSGFNGLLGVFLWPFFARIIGRKGREVELVSSWR